MRQIGSLQQESLATKFSVYLFSQKIDNSVDASFDVKTEQPSYSIWVHDEDQIALASHYFERFQSNPEADEFNSPVAALEPVVEPNIRDVEEETMRTSRPKLTLFWIFVCITAFLLNLMQESSLLKAGFAENSLLMTPIRFKMLYDIPPSLDALAPAIQQRTLSAVEGQPTKDEVIPDEIKLIEETSYWRGIYF